MIFDKFISLFQMEDEDVSHACQDYGGKYKNWDDEIGQRFSDIKPDIDENGRQIYRYEVNDGKITSKERIDYSTLDTPNQSKDLSTWKRPYRSSYRNPNINVYPDIEGYNGMVETAKGKIINNKLGNYGYYPAIKDNEDYSDYYSDLSDILNHQNIIYRIFSKKRNVYASRNNKKKKSLIAKLRACGTAVSVLVLAASFLATFYHLNWKLQATLYLMVIAIAILTDVLKMVGRLWSQQARFFIFSMISSFSIPIWSCDLSYIGVAAAFIIISFLIVKRRNQYWLSEENWLLSPHVQTVLVNSPDSDPVEIWEETGFKEARTLCHEIGLEIDDLVLEGFCRPLVCLGISINNRKANEAYARAERSKKETEQAEKEAKQAKRKMKQIQEELEVIRESIENDNQAIINRLIKEKQLAEEERNGLEEKLADATEEIEDLKRKLQDMDQANRPHKPNESNFDVEEEKAAKKAAKEAARKTAEHLFLIEKKTVSEVMEATGLSRGTASRIRTEVMQQA